jgi:hypothetical protein
MTKFAEIKLSGTDGKRCSKKTVFNKFVDKHLKEIDTCTQPKEFDNVVKLPYTIFYPTIFIAWNDDDPANYTIYTGEAGDEFNNE